MEDNSVSRRDFLNHSAKTLIGASVAAQCTLNLTGCGKASSSAGGGGSTTITPTDGKVTLSFADYPDLESANGAYQITVTGTRTNKVINVHNVSGTVTAVNSVCTHEGCTVAKWNGSSLNCPCHGSTYNATGAVTGGPAPSALTSFTTSVTATGVEITVG